MAKLPTGRKLLTKKVSNNNVNEFTETLDFKILNCSNVDGNNNKYYCIELQKNPIKDTLRLFSQYGRVGESTVYEVRELWKEDNSLITSDQMELIEKEMDFIVRKKLRGKSTKRAGETVKANYEIVDVSIPKVGSTNIVGKNFSKEETTKAITPNKKKPIISTKVVNFHVNRIIEQAIEENIHNITSATSIKFNNGRYETPLGPVTLNHINKAKEPLNELRILLKDLNQDNWNEEEVKKYNNLYYSLIPHSFGKYISRTDWILDFDKLSDEYDILDQLESAVNLGEEISSNQSSDMLDSLNLEFVPSKSKEVDRLINKFENSRASNHYNLRDWKVINVFDLKLEKERKNYKNRTIKGKEVELFHGSRNCNILSIMSSGLIVPPVAAHGRMFGDGIYAAPASTKALNYSTGFWGGKNKYPNAFIFVVKFSLGREYNPNRSMYGGPPNEYDSIWAKAKDAGLYNDEVIVYSNNQCTLTHIIELEKN